MWGWFRGVLPVSGIAQSAVLPSFLKNQILQEVVFRYLRRQSRFGIKETIAI